MTRTAVKPEPRPPGPGPETNDDLKSLPMAEVQKRLGSSPDGLSQAEATKGSPSTGRTRSKRRRPTGS